MKNQNLNADSEICEVAQDYVGDVIRTTSSRMETYVSGESIKVEKGGDISWFSHYSGAVGCDFDLFDKKNLSNTTEDSDSAFNKLLKQYPSYSLELKRFIDSVSTKQKYINDKVNIDRNQFGRYMYCGGRTTYEKSFNEGTLGIHSVRISRDGQYVALGFSSGRLELLNKKYRLEKTIFKGNEIGSPITCIKFDPKSYDKFFISNESKVQMCSLTNNVDPYVLIKEPSNEINSIDLPKSGNYVITAGRDTQLRQYDIETNKEVSRYESHFQPKHSSFHQSRIYMVRCNPDVEHMFVSGGWDREVKIWDIRGRCNCVCTLKDIHVFGDSLDIKHGRILTASWSPECNIKLWDLRKVKCPLIVHCDPKNNLQPMEGEYTVTVQFLDTDVRGDLILRSSMTHKSLDVLTLEKNLLLHSYTSNGIVECCDSYDSKIIFGNVNSTFVAAEFELSLPSDEFKSNFERENEL